MKFNQWTLGLAAIGLVSLTSAARADEKTSSLGTALSSTMLSGYVDTSAQWNLGTGNTHAPGYAFGGPTKADGFNLNVVDINLEKDADAADGWGAGYKVELWLGPDANALATQASGVGADLAVKNAYVDLKAPVGNGLDFKIGVFDTIIGYEVADSINNPNFTRSWGFTMEPTTHTGILGTYVVNDMLSASAGIANTFGPMINQRAPGAPFPERNESYKTYMASVTFTASTNWGWVGGSTLTGGIITGFNSGSPSAGGIGAHQTSLYVGSSINTPLTALKLGWAYDYVGNNPISFSGSGAYCNAGSLYATFQATEKLGLNGRIEYASFSKNSAMMLDAGAVPVAAIADKMLAVTATLQYDLWKNVLTRVEARWDHALDGSDAFGGTKTSNFGEGPTTGTLKNSYELIANVAYKF